MELLLVTLLWAAARALPQGGCAPCSFPFLYKGHLHFECTTDSPVKGDFFGRCPGRLEPGEEASQEPGDWVRCDASCPLQAYTSNAALVSHLESLAKEFPETARLVEVGNSSLGQRILGLRITEGVQEERAVLKPMVRFSGNMHGNEPVGREMLAHLATYLLRAHRGLVPRVVGILNTTDITLIPTINPDGFDRGREGACSGGDYKTGRYNEGHRDLNRDFPTWRDLNKTSAELRAGRQPETLAMMDLILGHPWVLSANFHDGAVVASYPYDDYRDGEQQEGIHKTPDHAFFKHIATTYATNHQTMMDPKVCTKWWFEDGITNGADWYPLNGGMQDFNYLFSNGMEITMELSCCKFPRRYYLNKEWERNRASLLAYLEQAGRGVRGLVRDSGGELAAGALVTVLREGEQEGRPVTSSDRGEYWRLLLPGNYSVTAELAACETAGVLLRSAPLPVTLTEGSGRVAVVDIMLDTVVACGEGPR